MFEVPFQLTGQTGSIALALTSSLYSPLALSSLLYVSMISISPSIPYQTPHLPAIHGAKRHSSCSSHCVQHAATGITPQDQIPDQKAKKNQDLEHTELEMLITMNVHIPLPNPNPKCTSHFLTLMLTCLHHYAVSTSSVNLGRGYCRMGLVSCKKSLILTVSISGSELLN